MTMLCPFDLEEVVFKKEKANNRPGEVFVCPINNEQVPAQYVRDYRLYPPVVVSAVGFRGHGKTVYFASLFHVLKRSDLAMYWSKSRFFTQGLCEDDLNTIYTNMSLLEKGTLPDSTPKNFPRPTMIRVSGVPGRRNCTWLCYDTAGECFEKPSQLVMYANFVRRARCVLLMISLADCSDSPAKEMMKLLNIYTSGLRELGGMPEKQHLVVVYTKGDELGNIWNGAWTDLGAYLSNGTVDALAQFPGYIRNLYRVSARLERFTAEVLRANEFLNAAYSSFRGVKFCLVSALGVKPEGRVLQVQITPKRVLDPMLWVMHLSQSRWRRFWERLVG